MKILVTSLVIIVAVVLGFICGLVPIPFEIHSDRKQGINIRVLPIRYGLLRLDHAKKGAEEFWTGGCIVDENAPKWAIVY